MTRDADRSSRTHRVKRAPGARPSVGWPIIAAYADQTTNRLWVLKTGSALMNRRIKARMLRAFRMVLSRSTIAGVDAKAFQRDLFFLTPPCAGQPEGLGSVTWSTPEIAPDQRLVWKAVPTPRKGA